MEYLTILHTCLVSQRKTTKKKKTTKNNDENGQVSAIFGIFRQI